jgi:hypothetical protein
MSRGLGVCANLLCAGATAALCFQWCAPTPVVVVQQQPPPSSGVTAAASGAASADATATTNAPLPTLMLVRP